MALTTVVAPMDVAGGRHWHGVGHRVAGTGSCSGNSRATQRTRGGAGDRFRGGVGVGLADIGRIRLGRDVASGTRHGGVGGSCGHVGRGNRSAPSSPDRRCGQRLRPSGPTFPSSTFTPAAPSSNPPPAPACAQTGRSGCGPTSRLPCGSALSRWPWGGCKCKTGSRQWRQTPFGPPAQR